MKYYWCFFLFCAVATNLPQRNASQPTTIAVGQSPNESVTTTITVTPIIGQSVELQCDNGTRSKQWYTTGSEVAATPTEISTTAGNTRILAFSSFTPSHAGTYTCLVSFPGDTQTKTTYPVVLVNPLPTITLTVGRTDDSTTPITITPTLSQPVWLECQRTDVLKDWFTGDPRSRVTPTEGEISTKSGHDRTLLISSFKPIHATTYSCIVDHTSSISTVYPVVLETSAPVLPLPSPVQGVMLTRNETSLNVSWTTVTYPIYNNMTYKILYVVWYSNKCGIETDPPFDAMKRSGITATSTTLTGLEPNTTYYVWVAAEILAAGVQGPYVPSGPPLNLKAITSRDSAILKWDPPTEKGHNGVITGYLIKYQLRNNTSSQMTRTVGAVTQLSLDNLLTGVTYSFTVAAISCNRSGPDATMVDFSTISDTPPNSNTVGIVVGIVVVLLGLIILVVILCIVLTKKQRHQQRKQEKEIKTFFSVPQGIYMASSDHEVKNNSDEAAVSQISKTQFAAHVRELAMDKNNGFEREYNKIQNDPNGVNNIAKAHKKKNRYHNIHTFDHSRVVLSVPDENGSDYINASYIDGFERKNAYIASQGPTPKLVSDFWQMIWDHRLPVIVMLTQPEEKGKKKCERYWKDDTEQVFEPGSGFCIKLKSCDILADYEVREMLIENMSDTNSKPFTLKHFLYTGWPNHGVPQHPSSLVRFARQVRKVYQNSQQPLIVHCSAGVGRTGTFITIDAMMQKLKETDDLNIYEFVTEMRSKRTFMVQNLDQYVLIHDALNDYLTCGETAVPAHELRRKITDLEAPMQDKEVTGFQSEFDILNSVSKNVCSEDILYSQESPVAWKNRYKNRFPYCFNYLHISGRTEGNGNDYMNASFINSYSSEHTFIAAQSPLIHTRDDLWKVVWQLKTSVIVLLCDIMENEQESCVQFWPSKNFKTGEYSFIKVDLLHAKENQGYTIYTLNISDKRKPESNSMELTLFHSSDWKADGPVQITPLERMIADVEKKKCGSEKPVIVMCDDGMGRTGVFITAMSEIERVKVEREVDIFQTVKAIRMQRPNMVSTVEQYKLCYEMLLAYLNSFDEYSYARVV